MIYRLTPFLPLSFVCLLPPFHAFWVKGTYFPPTSLPSASTEIIWVFRGWNVFLWPIFFNRNCVQGERRGQSCWLVSSHSFQNSPPHPPSPTSPSLSLSDYLSPYLYPFELHLSTAIFLSIFLCSRKSNQEGSVLTDCWGWEVSCGWHW